LKIRRKHRLGIEEAKHRVDQVAEDISRKWNLTSKWDGDLLHVRGSGVTAQIAVAAESVEIHVRTGLAMMMFRESIRSEIEGSIDEHIA